MVQAPGQHVGPDGAAAVERADSVPVQSVHIMREDHHRARLGEAPGTVPLRRGDIPADGSSRNGKAPDALEALLSLRRLPTFMWALPCYGNIHTEVYRSHMAAIGHIAKLGIRVMPQYIAVTNKMGLASAENHLAQAAIDLKVDYVFWTEQDMVLPHDIIPRLFDRQKMACSALYFLRGSNGDPQPCMYQKYEGDDEKPYAFVPVSVFTENKLVKVDACGMGAVLMKREVLEAVDNPRFDDREGQCGTDMYFWTHVWRKGIEVFVDTGVQSDQINENRPEVIGIKDWRAFVERHGLRKAGFVAGENVPAKATVAA